MQNLRLFRHAVSGRISIWNRNHSGMPPLTKDLIDVKRGPFNAVTSENIQFFKDVLGPNRVLTDSADVESYNVDWLQSVRGMSTVVLKPKTTEEVSKIVKYCNDNTLAVCPQSGNTGLVGGSVPVFDEVVLSMVNMNEIIKLDEQSGTLTCQAGCVLEKLDQHLRDRNLMMPLDLGAKGSCLIGGNVSTNAGGLRLLRYGSLHGNVLGLEVVLANGQVLDLLSTLKKDNTGYHLKHLFIGAEGTLGVVTKVAVQCPPLPKSINVALMGLSTFEDVIRTFQSARRDLGEILSSCEMMDQDSLDCSVRFLKTKNPLSKGYPFYVLIETSGSNATHDVEKLESFLEKMMECELVSDAILNSEPSRISQIWQIRERIADALKEGYAFHYDISLPLSGYYSLVESMRERLKGTSCKIISGFGHLGDGNLHLNILAPEYDPELFGKIEPFIFECAQKLRGSVSAEHGIGLKKTQFLHFSKSDASIAVMKDLKKMFDPKGILNPYKVLPRL